MRGDTLVVARQDLLATHVQIPSQRQPFPRTSQAALEVADQQQVSSGARVRLTHVLRLDRPRALVAVHRIGVAVLVRVEHIEVPVLVHLEPDGSDRPPGIVDAQ